MNILLVDDEPEIVNNLGLLLRHVGHKCTVCYAPYCARLAARHGTYNVVITDYNMPEVDGLQLAEEIKALQPDVQVFIMTGSSNINRTLEQAGDIVKHVLLKPLDIRNLLRLLEQIETRSLLNAGNSVLDGPRAERVSATANRR